MNQTSYRSLYTYAWDVQDIGVTAFVDELLAMGISDVTLATSYHAGKFIRPHAKNPPRVIFPEDGVVYFDPDFSRYAEIKPQPHSDATTRAVLPALLKDGRLKVHGWTVLLHNSRIGAAFPQYTVKNAFGDPYVYSLCPMQPAVFDYAVALCADLTAQHDLASLVLETPGWLPYSHGYHHEFAQIASNACLDILLGLCFCPACKVAATEKGIAIDALQTRVEENISGYLAQPFDATKDQNASALQSKILNAPDFLAVVKLRQERVTELVRAIRKTIPANTKLAVIPTVQRPTSACWIEGSDLHALSEVADYIEIPFYKASANHAIADASESIAQSGATNKIRAILRPGFPDLKLGAEIAEAINGIQALGVTDFAFYNYGLLPQIQLDKLAATLQKESTDGA
jgi:hypothetical protein